MTALRQKLIDELDLRGFSPNTKESYIRFVAGLATFYKRSPDLITDPEIKAYLLHLLREKKMATRSMLVAVSALRFFYRHVLSRPTDAIEQALPRMKEPVSRPQVYSVQELEQLFSCPDLNRKHRALLMTAYAAGLRVSELCRLKIEDIRSDRMQIRIVSGKGSKDRYTLLSPRLLEELRVYWQQHRPQHWLFPSPEDPQQTMTRGSVLAAFHVSIERAGLPSRGGIHSLRHSFATHLLEAGVDLLTVQRLLGHSHISTTTTYLHVRQVHMDRVNSALDLINFGRTQPAA
jgi:site-specific recombinase XerD